MIDSVNAASQSPAASLQNAAAEQESVQKRTQEEQQTVQQTASQDSVTIRSEAPASPEEATRSSIQTAEQAQAVASRVASLFQEQPELSATAQGGQLNAEKADAYLSQNFG